MPTPPPPDRPRLGAPGSAAAAAVGLTDDELAALVADLTDDELAELVEGLPTVLVEQLLALIAPDAAATAAHLPQTPMAQALELEPSFRRRDHLLYLSKHLTEAVKDVEAGRSRRLLVSMPPRMGKSTLASLYLPIWLLRRHPSWSIGMISHDGDFATSWGRRVRGLIERTPSLGIRLAGTGTGATAASEWETIEGGGVLSRSIGGSITGRGFKVLIMDDVVKGVVDAHSARVREMVWDRWRSDVYTRLEPPFLCVVIGTRWHEDDFLGRLQSSDYEGDPAEWRVISFPALAESDDDALGRVVGEPLISPLEDETPAAALVRWASARETVGSYTWASLYQQRPAPARGAIFDTGWWRFWTSDPARASADGRVVHLPPEALSGARWLDSWDAAFKGTDSSDWVVGQRWARKGAARYLLAQVRGRWSFNQTLAAMRSWADPFAGPTNRHVHERLIEDKANGPAILDTLREEISGLRAIDPKTSKEARARSITPEVESGHVYLPHPADPGNEWVDELLSELRNFPNDANDDQVDALTQALTALREEGRGSIGQPAHAAPVVRNLARAAQSDLRRPGRTGVYGLGR